MKITLGQLRRIIHEAGLDSDMRNMAGSFMDFGGSSFRDRESSVMDPLPGLGDEEHREEERDDDEMQDKSQPGARVADRHPMNH